MKTQSKWWAYSNAFKYWNTQIRLQLLEYTKLVLGIVICSNYNLLTDAILWELIDKKKKIEFQKSSDIDIF